MKKGIIIFFTLSLFFSCKNSKEEPQTIIIRKSPNSKYTCIPPTTDADWYKKDNIAPLLDGYDVIDYPITTSNPLVQRYFNQGLALAYAFNHAEAARSFHYATRIDPNCAMAFWGLAYVLGPNYNAGMEPDNYGRAFKAIEKAKSLAQNSTKKEQEIIEATAIRYSPEPPEDRSQLDLNYSKALKLLQKKYPDDVEIGTLYVESLMNVHPWDLYNHAGEAKPWTHEIVNQLEYLIKKNPKHPGAHHFYIHAVESSNTPERSNESAKAFDNGLVPGSGHLLHMPSHTYIRTGEYHKGTLSNIASVKADSSYISTCHAQGAYPLAYYPHNYHFMAATATLEGNKHWAMIGANKVSKLVHPEIMKEPGWGTLQHYYTIPYYIAVKFKMWDEILEMSLDTYQLNYVQAIQHYAQGMAYLGQKNMKQAKIELTALDALAKDESMKSISIWEINTVYDLVQIAKNVLEAEILAEEGQVDKSIIILKETVAMEDALNYNEPPDWFFSIRHHLGAIQLQAKLYEDAIVTYKADLKKFPKNGWAQHGLKEAYSGLNDLKSLAQVNTDLDESWAHADYKIEY
ncbi:hypothetical protein [Algibacter mikhailovii]|uniref:Tetratricopeptide repeat protein n=1 Tax=Algibacter mikhailovii TaxID=425498 RepID=A0A918VDB6_9FLAO|nr:hypothetical protein [Algibacter mikhailovii]GGZ92658.1 hypothetical protein GCM10007028_33830 [Algibacter mikhailovii]